MPYFSLKSQWVVWSWFSLSVFFKNEEEIKERQRKGKERKSCRRSRSGRAVRRLEWRAQGFGFWNEGGAIWGLWASQGHNQRYYCERFSLGSTVGSPRPAPSVTFLSKITFPGTFYGLKNILCLFCSSGLFLVLFPILLEAFPTGINLILTLSLMVIGSYSPWPQVMLLYSLKVCA